MPVLKKKEKINPRELHRHYLDSLEEDLEKKGLVTFEAGKNLHISKEFLALPAEITEVPSRDLGEYLNAFTQQKLYLRTLLGRIELELEESKQAYYARSAETYRKLTREKVSETAKERMIVVEMQETEEYKEFNKSVERKRLVELGISNIEDAVFLLSREVSRRNGDFNAEQRTYNL